MGKLIFLLVSISDEEGGDVQGQDITLISFHQNSPAKKNKKLLNDYYIARCKMDGT